MNRLASETSPYLLQHAGNPVDWYPWGEEALGRARGDDRPILLSIGYAACHWCHVMEHESFEDEETAAQMNEQFVCIKVDREERPDLDAIYMDAVVALTGHGGWPMTVFLTPAGEPFFGGTYYPPAPRHGLPSFRQVLEAVATAYRERREDVARNAQALVEAVLLGVFIGFVLGVTSAGSGSLIAVGLILLFRLAPKEVVATDVFHAAILLWAAALAHIVAGNVDWVLMVNILLGSIPGVWLGSHLVTKIEVRTLRTALAIVLLGGGLGLLSKAGAGIPPGVIAAVPVVLAAVVAWQERKRRTARRLELQARLPAEAGGG